MRKVLIFVLVLGCSVFFLHRCSTLPPAVYSASSTLPKSAENTELGRAVAPLVDSHPNLSGIYPLRDARDSFAARVRLARVAQRRLDVQYYIWEKDLTGTLLFQELHKAADRGVHVRLLLDDNNTSGLDRILAALDSHPNIEVRLFNPFRIRALRIGYLTDFFRANRRMHNKSFTADNEATIIGGRNVGDEYFGATEGMLFVDLDVLAIGPVVNEVSNDFERYWNSGSSYPANRLLRQVSSKELGQLTAAAKQLEETPQAIAYMNALRQSAFVDQLVNHRLEFDWATTTVISDDPAKGLGRAAPDKLFPKQLQQVIGQPAGKLDLVSSYFVPTDAGTRSLVEFAASGVKIRVLTNALEATDVPAVHSGYAKRRKQLLKAGIQLYELRRSASSGTATGGKATGMWGSSGSSLHAKTFVVDDSRVFIGSFNFDPRSANLNTELGFVIESATLAHQIEQVFDERVPEVAYQLHLTNGGQLYWTERNEGRVMRHDTEPGTSFWTRAFVAILSRLPIEPLL